MGSNGVASFNHVAAREELVQCHPQSPVPSSSLDVPPSLVVQPSSVLAALCSFSKGTFLGNFGFCPQHILDPVCGNTAPAASECLQALMCCVNYFLSGRLDSRAAPWFCGAPLTTLIKPSGGFRPIAVGKPFTVLLVKCVVLCCTLSST